MSEESKVLDQNFTGYAASLITDDAPYDPFTKNGDRDDDTRYIVRPGIYFLRPWLAIRGGDAFQWPLGLQGFDLNIDPTLGIHKYIGIGGVDLGVDVDVLHPGEEHITMTGAFPGDSSHNLILALKKLVYAKSPEEGKILYIPQITANAQRVQVVRASFSRDQDMRGRDMNYSIEFVKLGLAAPNPDVTSKPTDPQPHKPPKGKATHTVHVDSKHNTLRKIAAWKLGSPLKWLRLYEQNEKWFRSHSVPKHKAPDYRLPLGLALHY